MVKHTKTIRRHIADELFECVWPFCGIGASMVKKIFKAKNDEQGKDRLNQ